MKIIYRGAESIIYLDEYQGEQALIKERIKKNYRIDQIDRQLRKTRTKKEVKLLTEARKCGVMTPKVLHVDEAANKIIMEFIDGERVKELLNAANKKAIEKICTMIGESIGKLHANGIIHGDLTTSNMILYAGSICFIDFGLGDFSRRIEKQGVDLNLLQEAIKSTHYKILNLCWENIVKGYKKEYKDAMQVLRKVDEIERRARYVKRKKQD